MDKIKILLAGDNESAISEFFDNMSDTFECLTTSCRKEDMRLHIITFKPQLFLLCMLNEPKENISAAVSVRAAMDRVGCKFGAYGSYEELGFIQAAHGGKLDLSVSLGLSTTALKARIMDMFKESDVSELDKLMNGLIAESTKKHVLVIDDDPMMLKLVKDYLHEKYQVATAVNGRTALKFLESKTTDLILLDYEMPGENGPAVLMKLRENPRTKDLPVVFLTGVSQGDKIQEALVLKPQGYLLKPLDHAKLMTTIAQLIG